MANLYNSFSTEIIKSKNTFALWLTVIGAIIIPLTIIITYGYNWEMFIPKAGQNPWVEIYERSFNGLTLFTPLFLILIIALLFNIEHRSNAWKHIFVLPIFKGNFYLGKYSFLFLLIGGYYLLFVGLIWCSGIFLGYYKPELQFLSAAPEWCSILSFLIKFFIGSLAIIAIHFWLSFRIKNLVANLGIGLAGMAFAILFNGSAGYNLYFPYSFPILMLNYKANQAYFFETYHIFSMILFVIISIAAYFDFVKRFKG